jgi:hypothetical protein
MRTVTIIAAIFATFMLNGCFIYFGGAAWLDSVLHETPQTTWSADPVVVDVFVYTLEEEVRKKSGQPAEGYVPSMFLEAFPGLAETDFEGVEASIGYYTIEQGRLVHKFDNTELIHSAATAITRRGMETLLHNVASRTNIDLQTDGTITDIMSVLIRQ